VNGATSPMTPRPKIRLVEKNSGVSTITTMAAVWRPEVLVKVGLRAGAAIGLARQR